jgi:hypothetical protein
MDINLTLINKIVGELDELGKIGADELYDKEIVLNKIGVAINDLNELNTIKREAFKAYKEKKKQFYQNIQEHSAVINDISKHTHEYVEWVEKLRDYFSKKQVPPSSFLEEGKNYQAAQKELHKQALSTRIDNNLMAEVLNNYNHIHFMRKRKRWLWWQYRVFRFQILINFLTKLLISTTIGFLAEKLAAFFFSSISDFTITLIVAAIGYFILDKKLDKRFDQFYWRQIRNQILKVHGQFGLYLAQINILIENIRNDPQQPI